MKNLDKITKDKKLQKILNQAIDLVEKKKYWEIVDGQPAWKLIEKHKLHDYVDDDGVSDNDEAL